jgi:hypothetical protein
MDAKWTSRLNAATGGILLTANVPHINALLTVFRVLHRRASVNKVWCHSSKHPLVSAIGPAQVYPEKWVPPKFYRHQCVVAVLAYRLKPDKRGGENVTSYQQNSPG